MITSAEKKKKSQMSARGTEIFKLTNAGALIRGNTAYVRKPELVPSGFVLAHMG